MSFRERDLERYYNVQQVSRNLCVSTAWINKMQEKIPKCVDIKAAQDRGIGKRTTLSTYEYKMLKKIRTFRILGYSIKEVCEILENERPYMVEIKKRLENLKEVLFYYNETR